MTRSIFINIKIIFKSCGYLKHICAVKDVRIYIVYTSNNMILKCAHLREFNNAVIQSNRLQVASGQGNHWLIKSPTILYRCVACPYEIFVNYVFVKHIFAANIYTISR